MNNVSVSDEDPMEYTIMTKDSQMLCLHVLHNITFVSNVRMIPLTVASIPAGTFI